MLRQFLEIAAHLFVVYFDVAALLILVYKSWRAACGPFYSLKTWLLMKRTLWESGPVRRTMWLHTLVDDWFTGWFFFLWLIWCEMPTIWGGLGLCVRVFGQFLVFLWQKKPYWNPRHEIENGWLMFDDVLIWYWLKAYCPALESFP